MIFLRAKREARVVVMPSYVLICTITYITAVLIDAKRLLREMVVLVTASSNIIIISKYIF